MNSGTVPSFWEMYRRLPLHIRQAARNAYVRFAQDSQHPSLRFKPLKGFVGFWSVRITQSYRAVGRQHDDQITWFWIGSHADFDRDFA
jgi:Txe/YoeB family toxin of Txe-Axe toxin-antitoxin module